MTHSHKAHVMTKLNQCLAGFRNFGSDVKLTGIAKYHFAKSEWNNFSEPNKVSIPYLLWRFFYMVFFISGIIFVLIFDRGNTTHGNEFHFIFLTNWSFWTQILYSVLFFLDILIILLCKKKTNRIKENVNVIGVEDGNAVTMVSVHEVNEGSLSSLSVKLKPKHLESPTKEVTDLEEIRNQSGSINCLESVVWFLSNIVVTMPIFVTLGYWLTVYNPKDPSMKLAPTIIVHGLNTIFALIDAMVVALPVRITHFIYLVSFCVIYILFTVIYEVAVGVYPNPEKPYIYPLLNWRQKYQVTIGAAFVSLLIISSLHFILWIIQVFRLFVVSHCSCRKDNNRIYEYHCYVIKSPSVADHQIHKSDTNVVSIESVQDDGHSNPAFIENSSQETDVS